MIAVLAVAAWAIVTCAFVTWLSTLPEWQMTARNSPDGVIVDVYKEHEAAPTFSTLIKGGAIVADINRVNRRQLPPGVGTTIFHDESFRPGRWTLMLGNVKLDIMQRALIVDDRTEILPN